MKKMRELNNGWKREKQLSIETQSAQGSVSRKIEKNRTEFQRETEDPGQRIQSEKGNGKTQILEGMGGDGWKG